MNKRLTIAVVTTALVTVALGVVGLVSAAPPAKMVNVQLLALNDFHGNLLPPAGSSGRVGTIDAGGVEYLTTHINTLRATNRNTAVVSAGDMIGASPLLSALFHDEPTIEAFNNIGLDYNAVGNHEFDEGYTELLRMQNGGCHPVDGCHGWRRLRGRGLPVPRRERHSKGQRQDDLPGVQDRRASPASKVAFIGMTLEGHAAHRHAARVSQASTSWTRPIRSTRSCRS